MFEINGSYVMEGAVEMFRKNDYETISAFDIMISMKSGQDLHFTWTSKDDRDVVFQRLLDRMLDYQRCGGKFSPIEEVQK